VLGGAVVLVPGAAEAANHRLVFGWERFGGFVAPGTDPLAAPRLVVYGDGLAVADATRSLVVTGRVKSEIRNRAVAVLANPDNLRRRPGAPIIVDAPQTRFTATASHRRYTGVVDALEEYRAHRAYPGPLYDLLDDAAALRDRILGTGKLFRPAAVRLVVLRLDAPIDPHTPVRSWPAGVAIPPTDADRRIGQANLHGNAARRVIAGIGTPSSGVWQTFRTARGGLLQAAWRYLLPSE
jgi:hypothetical protein